MVGEDNEIVQEPQGAGQDAAPDVTEGEKEQVRKWLARIRGSKKHFKPAFDRMKKCQQIAAHGAYKEWLEDETRYVVPVLNRHVNQAVSQLYAKNPTAVAERRRRLLHTVWDGTQEQIIDATTRSMMGDPTADQELMAIQADIAQAQIHENMTERAAKTLTLLHQYQMDEQPVSFKTQVKSLVRRTKVNGVGYIKLNFLRENEMRPETAALAEDTQAKIRTIERLTRQVTGGEDCGDMEAKRAELESLLADMVANPDRVVREQIIYDYPRSVEIILDPKTRHLKSLLGCGWLAHQFDHTAAVIEDIYHIDIEKRMGAAEREARDAMSKDSETERTYRVYEVQNKYTQQVFVICEGYEGFLKRPAEPGLWFENFFNIIPLVFNEIEHDEEIYPPSDVWAARHMQFEYNRSREGLREHRIAARPFWLAARGRLEQTDKERLKNHAAHEIVEITPGDPKSPISSAVERGPTPAIDPNLYEVEGLHTDMLRSIGTQEANLGGTSGATATESSIAENSRMSSLSDNVDDLDDMLTLLARVSGQVYLQEMSAERVKEIVGPGAVWPEIRATRRELAGEIMLSIKAGSSGRPNQAAKLANLERAWPALSQLPNINPEPLARSYADLLDLDFEDMNRQGVLSIVAQNAMAKPAAGPPNSEVPAEQGAQGADNAPQEDEMSGAGQPAFPAADGAVLM